MDHDSQLKLQAYLDGELPEAEARAAANWLARDREAVALHTELRNTRQALVGFEIGVELPESREFFWSKIEREIQRLEPTAAAKPAPSLLARWRRMLVPIGAMAGLVLAALVVSRQMDPLGGSGGPTLEAAVDDSGAFTYRDDSARTTLVWLSYPAEDESADNDSVDTL